MAENIKSKKATETRHGGDVLIARIIACVIILLVTLFVRFNNRCIYDGLKFWYQENILEENYTFVSVIENIQNVCLTIKTSILEFISKISSADK